jgi:hypothetical protein
MDFTKSKENPNLYYIIVEIDLFVLEMYVDNLFLTCAEKLIAW